MLSMYELQKLCDDVPRFPNELAQQIFKKKMGMSIDEVFSENSVMPVAAGFRRVPPERQEECMQAMHDMAFEPRRLPTRCPRVLADQQREARHAAWRDAGRANPRAALARQGKRIREGVRFDPRLIPDLRGTGLGFG